ncbi:unnamed protein product [Clonostachys byssicola]|uniref:Alcohol dehydrogenase iron-type/glycerol dehydrogenase GldA domain-containing protein n=1 Tax=Clonostachys byssicola TaxID=160290 RepID=A0A9N9UYK4_9HYPO|nr:unnamed protein product [Clonostachys byssicola]
MAFAFGNEICRPAFANRTTPKLSYGLRFPEACAKHCQNHFHVLIMCSKSLSTNTDALERLRSALGDRVAGVRIGISPHTPIAEVVDIVREYKDKNIDCIVTLGAGSLTDGAKIVRMALANGASTEEDIGTLWGTQDSNPVLRQHIQKPAIPLIHIPTSLSGGEYQAIAGGTESVSKAKRTFRCEGANPELVIQDPELCLTTPRWVWLSTGIRAVDHCVETLCSLQSNTEGDEWAARGLPKLINGLLLSKSDPASLDARRLCHDGVVEAMCAVSQGVPLGGSHAIGHQLGPLGVGHGETSCILLPAVCKYNLAHKANVERQEFVKALLLQQRVVDELLKTKGLDNNKVDLGDVIYIVVAALGMPQSLEDVGISHSKLDLLARNSLDDIWIRTNPVPITESAQVMDILRMCASKK